MIANETTRSTINAIAHGATNYPPNSVERNICKLLLEISNIVFSHHFIKKEVLKEKKPPNHYESLSTFCNKNSFGRSTIFTYIKKNNLYSKPYIISGRSDRNYLIYYVDPILFLQDIIKIGGSAYIVNKAKRSLFWYEWEKNIKEGDNGRSN